MNKETMAPTTTPSEAATPPADGKQCCTTSNGANKARIVYLPRQETPPSAKNESENSSSKFLNDEVGVTPSTSNRSDDAKKADWSPLSDGIITISSTSVPRKSDEEIAKSIAERINNVLYGRGRRRRRLPVFEEICPSSLFEFDK